MGKRNFVETIKSENVLVNFLLAHRGKENVVSSKEIARHLTENGFPIQVESANTKVKKVMMERHLPICHINGRGYYWASNKAELRESIGDLENRISAMRQYINHLKHFIF